MQQVELVNQAVTLEQIECSVHGNAMHAGIATATASAAAATARMTEVRFIRWCLLGRWMREGSKNVQRAG